MNCTCIADIEKKVAENLAEQGKFKKPIKKVRMKGIVFCFGKEITLKTVNTLEIELEGQKKMVSMNMLHRFCPFCGVNQEETA